MEKRILQLKDYRAAYLESSHGQETGVPVICLHGFLGEGSVWLPLMEHLPIRWIALDLLGFGSSSKPDLRYNIWHQVAFLQEFVGALGLKKFWLMGHSYGGWTAAAYTIACATGQYGLPQARHPLPPLHDACAGLILVTPAGIRDDAFAGRYAYLRPLLWESDWVDRGIKLLAPLSRWTRQQQTFAQIQAFRQAVIEQPVAKSFIRDRLRPEDAIDTVEQDLHRIALPTLVIAAAQDDTIPLWHCRAYAEGIPNATLNVLQEADHSLLQTCPDALAQCIIPFLKENTPKDGDRILF
jgi:pimeloyl-ACP methyl ester carboxylesterase